MEYQILIDIDTENGIACIEMNLSDINDLSHPPPNPEKVKKFDDN